MPLTDWIKQQPSTINNERRRYEESTNGGHHLSGIGTGYGMIVNGNSGAAMKNCILDNFSTAVLMNNSDDCVLQGIDINGSANGVVISNSDGCTVGNNLVQEIFY